MNESGEAVPVSEWIWEDGQIKPHSAAKRYSSTPDQDFSCSYPCEIILSHIPVPAHGKDKNKQPQVRNTLAARRPVT